MKTSTFNSRLSLQLTVLFLTTFFSYQTFGQGFPSEVSKKGLVLDGKVSSKKGVWSSDKSTIYTINWFKTYAVYFGNAETRDSIPILTKGGMTEEGLLVVTHSRQFESGYSYLMALEPCLDCVKGLKTWKVKGSIGEFKQKEYIIEKARWANKPRFKELNTKMLCPQNSDTLYLAFSNLYLTLGIDSIEGYIDIKSKTVQSAKSLYSLASSLEYTSVFGSYAVSNQKVEISAIGSTMQAAYSTVASDLTSNEASFTMTKNPSSLVAYSLETYFTPTARISFKIATSSLDSLSSELTNLFSLELMEASYICEGRTYSFNEIIIDKKNIGVEIEGQAASILYKFEEVAFNTANDEYSFTVYATSDDDTYLKAANIQIDFS